MIKRYELFTTDMCPKCPAAKDFMKTAGMEGDLVNASTDDGLKKASERGVTAVPTVIFFDEEGNEVKRAHSVDEIKKILEENKE